MWRDIDFLYLDHTQVETYMPSYVRIVELLEIALRDKFEGKADCPVKIAVSPEPEMYIHALPGFLPSLNVAGLKWQSNVVDNPLRGLPFNMGFVVLNEPDIGAPRALMDCMWITACRTAGISMVAVKHLAPSGANTVGLVGLGMQGRMHLRALRETAPHLRRVKCYDRDPAALSRFIQEASGHGPPDAVPCKTPEEAVRDSDIVITCTTFLRQSDPVVVPGWIKEGSLALPVDIGSYWTPEARDAMTRILTDDIDHTQAFAERGFFQNLPIRLDGELGAIIAGAEPGRQSDVENLMCINVGLGLFDIAVAQQIYETAKAEGAGTWLRW